MYANYSDLVYVCKTKVSSSVMYYDQKHRVSDSEGGHGVRANLTAWFSVVYHNYQINP